MRHCLACHIVIRGPAIWNLALSGPCCTPACVDRALAGQTGPLAPQRVGILAAWLSTTSLTPTEYRAWVARRATLVAGGEAS